MAWPLTPLTTYLPASTPAIKAADLNAIQDAITQAFRGTCKTISVASPIYSVRAWFHWICWARKPRVAPNPAGWTLSALAGVSWVSGWNFQELLA